MDRGLDKRFLWRCLWTTGWVSAFIALLGWRLSGFDWAGRYAAVALFAWINWVLLAHVLLGVVERNRKRLFLALGGKLCNLGWFAGLYLPLAGAEPTSLLAGVNTFFFVVLMKILGQKYIGSNSLSFSQKRAQAGAHETPPKRWS